MWLEGLRHSSIGRIPDLHAKLYMNESLAVIVSMNLYEYSQVNNEEMGVLFGRREDRREFKELMRQAQRLIGLCRREHGNWDTEILNGLLSNLLGRGMGEEELPEAEAGEPMICYHCIRCGHVIPSTHEYVYCDRCMESWRRYSNLRYVEQNGHCYICGRVCAVSAERPACQECFRSNTDLIRRKCEAMRFLRWKSLPARRWNRSAAGAGRRYGFPACSSIPGRTRRPRG